MKSNLKMLAVATMGLSVKADAIILRNGAALAHPAGDGSMEIGSTRGITLDGSGALCVRSLGMFQIDYEIVRK